MARVRGFSLIEILITSALIGSMIVFSSLLVQTVQLSRYQRIRSAASTIAQGKLDSLRAIGYDQLPASGPWSDTSLESLPGSAGTLTVTDYDAVTKKVSVSVTWVDQATGAQPSVLVTTLITKTGGLR